MRALIAATALATALALGCGGGSGAPSGHGGGAGATAGGTGGSGTGGLGGACADPDPAFSAAERDALAALSPLGAGLPPPPPDPTNHLADDPAAAALGQKLFNEMRFSGRLLDVDNDGSSNALGKAGETGKVACAGCHVPAGGFSDTRSFQKQVSLGAGWGRRRAPSLLDIGQAKLLMWDGRHDTLYNQVFGPIEAVFEMNSSRLFVAEQIHALYQAEYEAVFGPMPPLDDAQRFPPLTAETTGCAGETEADDALPTCLPPRHGMPGDGTEYDGLASADQTEVTRVVVNMGKAIGAYERTLSCGAGRFDAWVHGKLDALSRAEQRGAALFVGRAGCVSCHAGPFFSDQQFHDVGLMPDTVQATFLDADDPGAAAGLALAIADPLRSSGAFSDAPGGDGRLPAVVSPAMTGAFRTPTLRCVAGRPAFMHTGQMQALEDMVAFFDRGGDLHGFEGVSEIAAKGPLGLSACEAQDLVAFLRALDGT